MPVRTRVTAHKTDDFKCLELGDGAGVVIDPVSIETAGRSNHGVCKSIKLDPKEFEHMLGAIPNAERLKPVKCPLKNRKPVFDPNQLTKKRRKREVT
ncbi:hypothetical protein SPSIL_008770 [Sporomusa silvacetica DSM 10669]|uniref:Uncharacterized protein n=1 Tax=Sporomusa silvacetica DSM 10669 TaxID=1123289 RepID=A0ABZ3IHD3_9FIRM|nr:hypothetical protein [Sporomusa silvacetica]OZC13163.1 hypothetical protein SPSIL_56190 [Sporomusa silvacetica DSM 10669]